MATHQEKDALIKKLKEELRDLRDKVTDNSTFDTKAVSIVRKDGNYYLIKLSFDINTGKGKVVEEVRYGIDSALPLYFAKKYLVMDILKEAKEKK